MPATRKSFQKIVEELEKFYGRPAPPKVTDPLGMILLENVAYLVRDQQRERAFNALRDRVGLEPTEILSAPDEILLEVARLGGMRPPARVDKLRRIAHIALHDFDGDLGKILKQPPAAARKSLKKFPGIGDPGADEILLFSRTQPVLALPNVRVLVRLGFGQERKSYAATYRSAQEAVAGDLKNDYDWLIAAHLLLQRHGRELCKNAQPICAPCPLKRGCRFYRENVAPSRR